MLIGWSGIASWELICFILHTFRSTSRPQDMLFHQQQVILRSRAPALDTVFKLTKLAVEWRSNTPRAFLKNLPLIGLGSLNMIVFLVAGILVSRTTSPDSEVLARGKCGFIQGSAAGGEWLGGNSTQRSIGDVLYQAASKTYRDESFYARSCYGNQLDRSPTFCKLYKEPYIPSTRVDNATCPFATKVCMGEAITFDTGRISSRDLGINTPNDQLVDIRKTLTCAPLAIEQYASGWTSEQKPGLDFHYQSLQPNDTYKYYNLGPLLSDGTPQSEYTFAFSNAAFNTQDQAYRLM